jgi:hypothetical protein
MQEDFLTEFDDLPEAQQYTLDDALGVLPIDTKSIVPPQIIYGFSDLEPDDINRLRAVWQTLADDQRAVIMERIADGSEVDFGLDYAVFSTIGYDDPHQAVRLAAVRAGWIDERPETLVRLMELAQNDPIGEVRAAAILQVGQFIHLGELEELPKEITAPAESLALNILNNQDESIDVRRRALEAISQVSRPEVAPLIEAAYRHDDLMMRVSAINAMGNSCDKRWANIISDELEGDIEEMVYEAVRASGMIGLKSAVDQLRELGAENDGQIQAAAIWSLGEIGGDEATDALQELAGIIAVLGDEDLDEAIEDAIAMAAIGDLDLDFDLFDDDDEDYLD